jgi:hypothetical protein
MISAAFLGVFFALQSGTLESVVYDTVLEETGDSEAFELTIGRVRLVESVALVASALAGGAIAQTAPLGSVPRPSSGSRPGLRTLAGRPCRAAGSATRPVIVVSARSSQLAWRPPNQTDQWLSR